MHKNGHSEIAGGVVVLKRFYVVSLLRSIFGLSCVSMRFFLHRNGAVFLAMCSEGSHSLSVVGLGLGTRVKLGAVSVGVAEVTIAPFRSLSGKI